MKHWLLALAAIWGLSACGAPGDDKVENLSSTSTALDSSKSKPPTPAPTPDLCGTWEAVELSVSTPIPGAHTHGPDFLEIKDTHTFCRNISVKIPASLEAVGNTEQAIATVTFSAPGNLPNGKAVVTTCAYKGSAPRATKPSYDLVSCDRKLKSGSILQAQTFSLSLEYHRGGAPRTARVLLGTGAPPAADAYREYLGSTPNLAGVVLHVPASSVTSFSGVGLADGPPLDLHAFVADGHSGAFVVSPSVQVTGTGAFGPGVRLSVPFDSAWIATLPPGSLDTLALQKVQKVNGGLEELDAAPVTDAVAISATSIAAGLATPGPYLTTIRDLTPLTFHNGALMNSGVNVYFIWAGNFAAMASSDNPQTALRQFVGDLQGSSWYDILSTYNITNRNITVAGEASRTDITSLIDPKTKVFDPYTVAVAPALKNGTLPTDSNGVYVVVAAPNVTVSSDFCSIYCGWHTSTVSGTTPIKYAFIGSAANCPSVCGINTVPPSPNGATIDGVISVVAHEIVESATDPQGGGWHGANEISESYSASVENADKCAWVFHSIETRTSPAPAFSYDMSANGHYYFIQSNWVNQEGGYCGMGVENVAISATPPASSLVLNQVGHFQVTVTNTGSVFMDPNSLVVIGNALGATSGSSLPVSIPVGLAPGASTTLDVPVQAPNSIQGNSENVVFQFRVRDPGNLHTFDAVGQTTAVVQFATFLVDQAACVSISLPASVPIYTWFPVMVTFQNTGSTKWLAGQYQIVGLPLDTLNPYSGLPFTLATDVVPSKTGVFTFSAYAPLGTYGALLQVSASAANAAATFGNPCTGTTQVECSPAAGNACNVGTGLGACANAGTVDCSGNCVAPAGIPDNNAHASPAPNGSWDWNCDGAEERAYTTVCEKAVYRNDNSYVGCFLPPITTETTDLASSQCLIDNCDCVANSVPACGDAGYFSALTCSPADPYCISLVCSEPSAGTQPCY